MHRRQILLPLAFGAALAAAPLARAQAQMRSAVAKVQLTAVVPLGASIRPGLGLRVNAPYRVEVHGTRGSDVTLIENGQPGLVPLKALQDSLDAAGLGAAGRPATVDLVAEGSF